MVSHPFAKAGEEAAITGTLTLRAPGWKHETKRRGAQDVWRNPARFFPVYAISDIPCDGVETIQAAFQDPNRTQPEMFLTFGIRKEPWPGSGGWRIPLKIRVPAGFFGTFLIPSDVA
jgi:hypothetical protein